VLNKGGQNVLDDGGRLTKTGEKVCPRVSAMLVGKTGLKL